MAELAPLTWALLLVAAVLGGCFQGSVGFGLGFTVVPLLVVVEPTAVPTVPLLLGLPLLAGTVLDDLSALDLGGSGWLVLGRLPGTALGAGLLLVVDDHLLGLVVGAVLLVTVAASLTGATPPLTRGTRLGAGFASGVMGTAAGVGGPPLSMLYRDQGGRVLRATVGVALMVGVAMSLSAVVVTGRWAPATPCWHSPCYRRRCWGGGPAAGSTAGSTTAGCRASSWGLAQSPAPQPWCRQ